MCFYGNICFSCLPSFSIFASFICGMVYSGMFLLELVDRFHDDACSKPCHMESLCLMYQMISYTHLQNNIFIFEFIFILFIFVKLLGKAHS